MVSSSLFVSAHAPRTPFIRIPCPPGAAPRSDGNAPDSLILVTNLVNVRYLTGFTGSAGMALFGPRQGILWVDPRYTLQAREQAFGVDVIEEKKGILKGAAGWLGKNAARGLAYEASNLTCAQFEQLRTEVGRCVRLRPAGDLIEELRVVKDRGEIEVMRSAGRVTAEVFADLLACIRPGVKECDLAAESSTGCARRERKARPLRPLWFPGHERPPARAPFV